CWELSLNVYTPEQKMHCSVTCLVSKNCSGIYIHNVQVCYISIHVPWWFAASINLSSTLVSNFSSL
uniref:Uncharacterized protein n=1 Tax=Macaca fascicularis TaxID=9541 RepID=A0A7N9I9R0_MACFA